ncbi:MAG: hypothetical protein JSV34_06505, partial [Candidatus Omnitrophota bacterium]
MIKRNQKSSRCVWNLLILVMFFCGTMIAQAAVVDTYEEDFDDREDGATINGVDSWSLTQGEATTQSTVTYEGGNSLKLTGATESVTVSRPTSYDDITTAWIEFIVRPQVGSQMRTVPEGKIAAVSFAHDSKIYASDGSTWTDTGETFTVGQWYRVTLKLDFSTHEYDIYIYSVTESEVEFEPVKENLDFIDTSISDLNQIGFFGAYNASADDDVYIDDLVIHFIDRLQIITGSYTAVESQPCGPITVQLQNSSSEPQTAWKDITLELSSTSTKGEFSLDKEAWDPVTQVVIPDGSNSVSFYYKDTKEGKPSITVNEYPDREWDDAVQEEKISAKAGYFTVSVDSPQIAGQYFTMTVTAFNEEGKIHESYSGDIEIITNYVSPGSGTEQVTPSDASGFANGVLEVTAMYPDCGIIEIIVVDEDDSTNTGNSGQVIFIPASFGVDCGTPQIVAEEFLLEVTAYNQEGAITYNYLGPVDLEVIAVLPKSISGQILSPSIIESDSFSNGQASLDISYNLWGKVKIKAFDSSYTSQLGISEPVQFEPAGISIKVENFPEDRDFFYIGENIEISMSVIDAAGEPISNYSGTVEISTTLGLDLPDEYNFREADSGKISFVVAIESAGTYVAEAYERESELTAQSRQIKVKQATIEVDSTVAPVGTTAEVIIRLVDEDGTLITSESTLQITVDLEEEFSNSSA